MGVGSSSPKELTTCYLATTTYHQRMDPYFIDTVAARLLVLHFTKIPQRARVICGPFCTLAYRAFAWFANGLINYWDSVGI